MIYFLKILFIKIYSLYAYILALVLLIPLGLFVLIFSFLNELKGGNLMYKACHIYAKVWFFLSGIQYKEINTKQYSLQSQYIFIANHTSYLDVLCLLRSVNQPVRVLGKQEMGSIPIFGFFYKKAVVTVDRGNLGTRLQSIVSLKKFIAKKISIFIFPEGTFNETDKPLKDFYNGAFKIAIDTQTPIQPILFLDNFKRMNSKGSFNLTPGKCRIYFADEIKVEGLTAKNMSELKNKTYAIMEKEILTNR